MSVFKNEQELLQLFEPGCRRYGFEGCSTVADTVVGIAEQVANGKLDMDQARELAGKAALKLSGCDGQLRIEGQGGGIVCGQRLTQA